MHENNHRPSSFGTLFIFYWAMYWLMNGLDKFLNRRDLGLMTWHGKDRSDQFGGYFTVCDLPEEWIKPLLYLVGIWEGIIFVVLAMVLWALRFRSYFDEKLFKFGMYWGAATFVIFSFFDVIFGDRAELLEHGTFLVLVGVTYHLVQGNRAFAYR